MARASRTLAPLLASGLVGVALAVAGCAHPAAPAAPAAAPTSTIIISIIGTNDLHGHITPDAWGDGGVALLGGYVENVRRARARDGGGVLLLDGGDLFQGTLESNLSEGAAVIAAYNALGYDAVAVGNHEFDFGPPGPRVTAGKGEDPRGALRARAAEAHFPILTSNIIDEETGRPLAAPGGNMVPSVLREVAGVRIGLIGVATTDTPTSTTIANFRGLRLAPLAAAIDREAGRLRTSGGATVIVVLAHAGLCDKVDDITKLQRCDKGEIVDVLGALTQPVDVVVAGHTHAGAMLRVGGTVITEAWKYGRGFGRVDLTVDRRRHAVVHVELHEPRLMRRGEVYEGAPVDRDPRVSEAIAPYVEAAAAQRGRKLGVRVLSTMKKSFNAESPLGNLSADLMRAARPDGDVVITNGGGLRNDLAPGDLTYGDIFEAFPFDNFFARVAVRGAVLRQIFEGNLTDDRGFLTISGMRAVARCDGRRLVVRMFRDDGREVADGESLTLITSDFLASGGMDGSLNALEKPHIDIEEGALVREAMILQLEKRGGTLDGRDGAYFDPARPRIEYPGKRPVTCGSASLP